MDQDIKADFPAAVFFYFSYWYLNTNMCHGTQSIDKSE